MLLAKSRSVVPSLRFEPSVDSTNAVLAGEHGNLPDFTVLVAAEQTAGQGRAGRSWISESGSSLSVSILLRPKELSRANLITLLAAASLHQALSQIYRSTISIKVAQRHPYRKPQSRRNSCSAQCRSECGVRGRGESLPTGSRS